MGRELDSGRISGLGLALLLSSFGNFIALLMNKGRQLVKLGMGSS
jgi:hypothetical protein